jgi:D-3-phosphoglycerate dehydrogenase
MPHVLVAGLVHEAGLALLREAEGFSFQHIEEISEASYLSFLAGADALVLRTQPLTAAGVAGAARLQVVSRHGVGYDAVDVAALTARGIPLCIAGDVNAVAVAEHAMMLVLACAKRLIRADRAVRGGDWLWRNGLQQSELAGKRLLIVGYGRIGRQVARRAAAFDMEVVAFDPFVAVWPEGARRGGSLAEGLAGADFVTLHSPKAGGPVLGAAELALLPRGAVVINTARGGMVEEAALAAALASGQVGAAGLDVFQDEPVAAGHGLLAMDQVTLTPHVAGLTREAAERMAVASVQNVLDHFAGRLDPDLVVNRVALAGG